MAGDYSSSAHNIDWDVASQNGDLLFNGSSTRGDMSDSADWQFSGDFTFEIFGVEFNSVSGSQDFLSQWTASGGQRSFAFQFRGDTSPKTLRLTISTDGSGATALNSTEWAATTGVRYNVCFERSGDDLRFYVDGSMVSKTAMSAGNFDSSSDATIGALTDGSNWLDGKIKAMRFTNGTARYADDGGYTVPDLPLPTEGPA